MLPPLVFPDSCLTFLILGLVHRGLTYMGRAIVDAIGMIENGKSEVTENCKKLIVFLTDGHDWDTTDAVLANIEAANRNMKVKKLIFLLITPKYSGFYSVCYPK